MRIRRIIELKYVVSVDSAPTVTDEQALEAAMNAYVPHPDAARTDENGNRTGVIVAGWEQMARFDLDTLTPGGGAATSRTSDNTQRESRMEPLTVDRQTMLDKANHAIKYLDEGALRSILRQCIDQFYFSDPSIERRAAKEGDDLRAEAALHLAGMMYAMDTDPEGTEDRENLMDALNQVVERDDFDARVAFAHMTNDELKAELDAAEKAAEPTDGDHQRRPY